MEKRLKIFLLDFPDFRAPDGYDRAFVDKLFFDVHAPGQTPDPTPQTIGQTVMQWMFEASNGKVKVKGDITRWLTSQFVLENLPEWNPDTMQRPSTTDLKVRFGELWSVVVAESLRAAGLTRQGVRRRLPRRVRDSISDQALSHLIRQEATRLPDGSTADVLVFLHTAYGSGGVKRGWRQLRDNLEDKSAPNNLLRQISGTRRLWNTLWDDGWEGLPEFLVCPLVIPFDPIRVGPEGFRLLGDPRRRKPIVPRMHGMNVIIHELGHLVLGLPDLYNNHYEPWNLFDIMHSSGIDSHHVPTISGYSRARTGVIDWDARDHRDQRIDLNPLETHAHAVRLPNGAPGHDYWLGLENRQQLTWPERNSADVGTPPSEGGRRLLAYRFDDQARLWQAGDNPKALWRETDVLSPGPGMGLGWQAGERIDGQTPKVRRIPGSTRNQLGEHWWSIAKIPPAREDVLAIDAKLEAIDLVESYHRARWTTMSVEDGVQEIEPGRFRGRTGHVIRVSDTPRVGGQSHARGLNLHPAWGTWSNIRGRYRLPTGVPVRVYATVGLEDAAHGTDGVSIQLMHGASKLETTLGRGEIRRLCATFQSTSPELHLGAAGGRTATRDWVWLSDAFAVPLPPVAYNLIARAENAIWRSNLGKLTYGAKGGNAGEVGLRDRMRLQNGVIYGPDVLFTHPAWQDDGFVEGTWPNLRVPPKGAYLRGMVGFHHGRRVTWDDPAERNPDTDNAGVTIDVALYRGNARHELLTGVPVTKFAAGLTNPHRQNDLTAIELAIPEEFNGKTIALVIRVNAAGRAAQDWVGWPSLCLTRS